MKHIVVDTNILIDEVDSVLDLRDTVIIIPFVVLEELDVLKNRDGSVRSKSRYAINKLIDIMDSGNIIQGIKIKGNNSIIKVVWDDREEARNKDDRVLDVVDKVTYEYSNTSFLTNDLSLRARAHGLGFNIHKGFSSEKSTNKEIEKLYIHSDFINELYEDGTLANNFGEFEANSYMILINAGGSSQSALVRYNATSNRFTLVKKRKAFGISTKNSEQTCALDALLNPNIPVVILTGEAGTGKTYLALASALEQVVERELYGKILISRPNIPIGNDLGFMPGNKDEKLFTWFGGYRDNIQQLLGSEEEFSILANRGILELEALTYLRGRSLYDCFIIMDEAQGCTVDHIKTILTRVGSKSKIVIMGDVTQIDNKSLTTSSNGLTHLVKRAKDTELISHIHLNDTSVRSKVTEWATKNL